jgi:hypothetical protein
MDSRRIRCLGMFYASNRVLIGAPYPTLSPRAAPVLSSSQRLRDYRGCAADDPVQPMTHFLLVKQVKKVAFKA